MDIVFWIILIVVIGVIIWWLLNRNKSANAPGGPSAAARADGPRTDGALEGGSAAASAAAAGTTGIPTAAGFGKPAEPAAPATAEEPADSAATSPHAARTAAPASGEAAGEAAGQGEWETQWSEAGPGSRSGSPVAGAAPTPGDGAQVVAGGAETSSGQAAHEAAHPVHHEEYTAPHAPTLPGAETAAVESVDDDGAAAAGHAGGQVPQHRADGSGPADRHEPAAPVAAVSQLDEGPAETAERTQSSALVENGADHHQPAGHIQEFAQGQEPAQPQGAAAAEPAGHLAADEPYGAGSAAAGPDGSGPADYTVKGDAAEMVYYEEGHPEYEAARAEVWFESAAHAEAAGFRAPRRKRL